MGRRQLWLVLALMLLLPGEAMAHRHRAGMFVIPRAMLYDSDFKGFSVSGSWPMLECHDWSAVGAFSRYSGTEEGKDFTLLAYAAGVRYTFQPDGWSPFLQLLGGGVDAIEKIDDTETSRHRTHGIVALGAGIDRKLKLKDLRLRVQVDLVHRFSGDTGIGISVGLGWQFGEVKKKDWCQNPNHECP